MHADDKVAEDEERKPDIVAFYNSTNAGVDILDKLCGKYMVKRKTLRLPLSLFFTVLDIAVVNTTVIWFENNPASLDDPESRRHDWRHIFLLVLGEGIAKPWLLERSGIQHVVCHPQVKAAMKHIGVLVDRQEECFSSDN